MLSEEEITATILECVETPTAENPDWSCVHVGDAAHAIAERLREGVLRDYEGVIELVPEKDPDTGESYFHRYARVYDDLMKMTTRVSIGATANRNERGKRIRMTVRREGDGQGVD